MKEDHQRCDMDSIPLHLCLFRQLLVILLNFRIFPILWTTSLSRSSVERESSALELHGREFDGWSSRMIPRCCRFVWVSPSASIFILLRKIDCSSFDSPSIRRPHFSAIFVRTSFLSVPSMNQTLCRQSWFTVPGKLWKSVCSLVSSRELTILVNHVDSQSLRFDFLVSFLDNFIHSSFAHERSQRQSCLASSQTNHFPLL